MRRGSEQQFRLLRAVRSTPDVSTHALAAEVRVPQLDAAIALDRLRRRRLVRSLGGLWRAL